MRLAQILTVSAAILLLGACEPADDSAPSDDAGETDAAGEQTAPAQPSGPEPGSPEWCAQLEQTDKAQWSASDARLYAEECAADRMKEEADKALDEATGPDDEDGTL